MIQIASPCEVREVNGEVLTTEFSIFANGIETKYVTDTYCIEDNGQSVTFQRHRKVEATE